MSSKQNTPGIFSLSLRSLSLSLATLMSESGGTDMIRLLDTLGELPADKRMALVERFNQIADQVLSADSGSNESTEFEDNLFRGILADFEDLDAPRLAGDEQSDKLLAFAEIKKTTL